MFGKTKREDWIITDSQVTIHLTTFFIFLSILFYRALILSSSTKSSSDCHFSTNVCNTRKFCFVTSLCCIMPCVDKSNSSKNDSFSLKMTLVYYFNYEIVILTSYSKVKKPWFKWPNDTINQKIYLCQILLNVFLASSFLKLYSKYAHIFRNRPVLIFYVVRK